MLSFVSFFSRKKPQLSKVSVQTTDIPPREIVTYAKQTQTVASPERGGMLMLLLRPVIGSKPSLRNCVQR